MEWTNYILATAGHVDHGKSSLVKALTGIDPDRLPEEKARGITIELGFANLDLPHPTDPSRAFRLGIVDVPGHEDFVKDMVAGVGTIDLALLVVAADDGWMPQTEEHLQILEYLGVKSAVIALTKCDLLTSTQQNAFENLRAQLKGTAFENAPIIPTSVTTDRGLKELCAILSEVFANIAPPLDRGKARLPIDRAFTLRGIGTIVTGTLTGGRIYQGHEVLLQPLGRKARVRAIQSHNKEVPMIGPGTRTALSIPELPLSAPGVEGAGRGHIIVTPDLTACTRAIDVLLTKSSRLTGDKGAARPLKDGTIVRVHYASTHFNARAIFYDKGVSLSPGQSVVAQLRFDQDVFVLEGERFVIRDWAEQFTLAGGLVLDRNPPQMEFQERLCHLQKRANSHDDLPATICAVLQRDKILPASELLHYSIWSPKEIQNACLALLSTGEITRTGGLFVLTEWWQALLKRAASMVDAHHTTHPELKGMEIGELRNAFPELSSHPHAFESFLAALCENDFRQASGTIARQTHAQTLPPFFKVAGERIRSELAAKPLEPPSRNVLIGNDIASRQALKFLIDIGEAVDLSPDLVISTHAFETATEMIKKHLKGSRSATASELRQLLGTSRRVVVPILEKLDKLGVTLRQGDLRVLRSESGKG